MAEFGREEGIKKISALCGMGIFVWKTSDQMFEGWFKNYQEIIYGRMMKKHIV